MLYGILCNIIYVTDFVRFRYIVGMAGEKDNCTLWAALIKLGSKIDTVEVPHFDI